MKKLETPFSIPTADGHKIYGVLHTPAKVTDMAVVLVHGLTGHMDEFLHLSFARSCQDEQFAVIRFNQYDDRENARRFQETTIQLHVEDTRAVMDYARSMGFSQLALIGHSLGAPVAIHAADNDTRSLVLWDPSGSPAERIQEWRTVDEEHGISVLDWRMRILLGDRWVASAQDFPDPCKRLSELRLPVKIIAAEYGGLIPYSERYRQALGRPHDYSIVPGAGHVFTEAGAIEKLAEETKPFLAAHRLWPVSASTGLPP